MPREQSDAAGRQRGAELSPPGAGAEDGRGSQAGSRGLGRASRSFCFVWV